MKYLPRPLAIIKDNLFAVPPIFRLIQKNSGADYREMYQVFNMGHRLEVFTSEKAADAMIATAEQLGIEARVVGRVAEAEKSSLLLKGAFGEIVY